ncbi:hypothetical protein VTO42DRAFT_7905 [Malbranchea cinnamomea]
MGRKRKQRTEYQEEASNSTGQMVQLPKKKLYRQRAHANPFSDHRLDYPISPDHMDWASHFPAFVDPDLSKTNLAGKQKLVKDVEVVDIGCGFGGLLVALSPLMPDTLMVGMELRHQVLEYVTARIKALRSQQQAPPLPEQESCASQSPVTPEPSAPLSSTTEGEQRQPEPEQQGQQSTPPTPTTSTTPAPSTAPSRGPYQNISAIRTNTMKFLPNFFSRHQLHSIFICFPDPHFKARKHKARIVSETLNAEYAFVLRPGGKVYTITDVEELHHWIVSHFEGGEGDGDDGGEGEEKGSGEGLGIKSLWERVGEEELASDPCVKAMMEDTEEAKKVTRNKGHKFVAVWRRKEDPAWPSPPPSPSA